VTTEIPIMSAILSQRILARRTAQSLYRRSFNQSTKRSADHVRVIEVGPRDGLQNEKQSIPVEAKLELIRRLAQTGIQTIEAGSFVAPKWVPQVMLDYDPAS